LTQSLAEKIFGEEDPMGQEPVKYLLSEREIPARWVNLLGDLPGDPVVVGYAPQLELVRRSTLTISHGGLNTALESLAWGVPMVVLPVTYDPPGVGARVEWSGGGQSIPVGRLTVDRLRDAVRSVLGDPAYRERAGRLQSSIEAADGLNRAADLIEGAFGTGRRAAPIKEKLEPV